MEIFGLGLPELIVIALVLLLLFGAAKLPALGRSIGQFGSEVKKGLKEATQWVKKEAEKEYNSSKNQVDRI